jgi:hypothetical protein
MFSSQNLLYLVLAGGVIAILYMTMKDMFIKPKNTAVPPAPAPEAAPASRQVSDRAVLPLQLQAYERLVLLIERINLQNLIGRVFQPGMSATDMQMGLVHTVRAEFDHNVSQQIYVTATAWEAVKTLKEQTITLINQAASQLPPESTAMDLNKRLLEVFMQAESSPAEMTAQIVNAEAKKLF